MTEGPGNARWPLHFSGRRIKNQDANAQVFSESQGFGNDKCRGLGNRNETPSLEGREGRGIVFIFI